MSLAVVGPGSLTGRALRARPEASGWRFVRWQDAVSDDAWLDGVDTLGVTAGASAPERLVEDLLATIAARMPVERATLAGIEETVRFRLPAELA